MTSLLIACGEGARRSESVVILIEDLTLYFLSVAHLFYPRLFPFLSNILFAPDLGLFSSYVAHVVCLIINASIGGLGRIQGLDPTPFQKRCDFSGIKVYLDKPGGFLKIYFWTLFYTSVIICQEDCRTV